MHTFVREIDYLLGSDSEDAEAAPGPAERRLLVRIADAPDRRLHKLEVHQLAREVGSNPRAVAGLYKTDPPLLRADGDHRVLTDAGVAWLAAPDTRSGMNPANRSTDLLDRRGGEA